MLKISIAFLVLVGVFVAYQVITQGVATSERNECLQWHTQARDFPRWYATQWQKDQCAAYGITLTK